MKFKMYWKDILFLEVTKKENIYYSNVIVENIDKVVDEGFSIALLANTKVIDNELPKIIKRQLPSPTYLYNALGKVKDYSEAIIEYINKTECKRATDKLSLKIEE